MTGDFEASLMMPVELRRIDRSHNLRRFYRLDIEPDLFGGFLLMKQWGRIGSRGQIKRACAAQGLVCVMLSFPA
jgi:hypothetical protein